MDQVRIVQTADGSPTLYLEALDETYHSRHGAVQESNYVFIYRGLDFLPTNLDPVRILEVGFGTGLNALLTLHRAAQTSRRIFYTALETYPLPPAITDELQFPGSAITNAEIRQIHNLPWNKPMEVSPNFQLEKRLQPVQQLTDVRDLDLIYYDAFGPRAQPDMWTPEIFQLLHAALKPGGVLVTYCAKGQVRRDLQSAGFTVERLPGPPMKREMIRAVAVSSADNS